MPEIAFLTPSPGRAFEGLRTKNYSTLRQRLLTNPPSTISSGPSIPEICPLQSGLTPLPSPALHIPPKPTKLCVEQSDDKQKLQVAEVAGAEVAAEPRQNLRSFICILLLILPILLKSSSSQPYRLLKSKTWNIFMKTLEPRHLEKPPSLL